MKIVKFAWILLISAVMASCASKAGQFYFGDYSDAERLYNKGEYEKAISKY